MKDTLPAGDDAGAVQATRARRAHPGDGRAGRGLPRRRGRDGPGQRTRRPVDRGRARAHGGRALRGVGRRAPPGQLRRRRDRRRRRTGGRAQQLDARQQQLPRRVRAGQRRPPSPRPARRGDRRSDRVAAPTCGTPRACRRHAPRRPARCRCCWRPPCCGRSPCCSAGSRSAGRRRPAPSPARARPSAALGRRAREPLPEHRRPRPGRTRHAAARHRRHRPRPPAAAAGAAAVRRLHRRPGRRAEPPTAASTLNELLARQAPAAVADRTAQRRSWRRATTAAPSQTSHISRRTCTVTTTAPSSARAVEHDQDVGDAARSSPPPRRAGRHGPGGRRGPAHRRGRRRGGRPSTASVPARGPVGDAHAVVDDVAARRPHGGARRRPAPWPTRSNVDAAMPGQQHERAGVGDRAPAVPAAQASDEERDGDERQRADRAAVELAAHGGRRGRR